MSVGLDKNRLGHYEILEEIGRGGMGVVFRARDLNLDREVAIKVLPEDFATHPDRLNRFEREARLLASVQQANIATVYGFERIGATCFLVMELLDGEALNERLSRSRMTVDQCLQIAVESCAGLEAAHARGIVHRDLKPANIHLTTSGVKILDFGLAKHSSSADTTDAETHTQLTKIEGAILGTASYMSPEQAQGLPVDVRSDVFSFGIVLFELLTGTKPFRGGNNEEIRLSIIDQPTPDLSLPDGSTQPELQRIIQRCLEKAPQDRFESATTLREALLRVQDSSKPAEAKRRNRAVALSLAALAVLLLGFVFLRGDLRSRWVDQEAIPQIATLLEQERFSAALALTNEALESEPNDARLLAYLRASSVPFSLTTEPLGALVEYRDPGSEDTSWTTVGITPLEGTRLPMGRLQLRVSKPGFHDLVVSRTTPIGGDELHLSPTSAPADILRIPAGSATIGAGSPTPLPTYWLAKFEVTNREYQEFVDAGGYESEELWPPMEEDGKRLDHTAAVDRFRDLTGNFGPSGWSFGSYPEGREDFPVRGLSWFEASAYARFAEASLPTVHHWRRAADPMVFGELLLESNFGDQVLAVGESGALGPFGTADMAGNVAEWCDTAIGDKRFVLGASWRDPSYVFANEPTLSPWQRLETVGFRLARYEQSLSQLAIDKAEVERYDFANVQIASDEVFQSLVSRYSYDAIDLDPQVLTREESSRHWRREVVALASPYSEERLQVALYIPKKARPPYQSVVWFPSSMAFFMPSIDEVPDLRLFQFVPKGGRVLALPAIARTHGRERVPLTGPNQHRDIFAQQVIDVRRTVDYLSTRADIDGESIALMGMSYGAEYAAVIAAVEKRLKTVILLAGGFDDLHMLREPYEIQPWHFAPRVLQPVLMLNGDADYSLPVSTAQKPLFDLLGTDPEHKKHVVLEGAHIPTDRHAIYRHSLDWFHRYLGAVAE